MIIKEDLESPARALRDVADDLAALATGIGAVTAPAAAAALTAATVATANATAPGVGYVQAEAASAATLANALKSELNKVIADNVALRTKLNEVITALGDVEAGSGIDLLTTKG